MGKKETIIIRVKKDLVTCGCGCQFITPHLKNTVRACLSDWARNPIYRECYVCPNCARYIAVSSDAVAPYENKQTNPSELAKEIFMEIEKLMLDGEIGGKYPAKIISPTKFSELKKKYVKE